MAKKQSIHQDLSYEPASEYKTKTAYFCMEYAIDPALRIYSGGLGFLAGSHVRSAYELKQNFIGIGMLWKYGYYDQVRHDDSSMAVQYRQRDYNFLEDTGINLTVRIHTNYSVKVKAYLLKPEVFGTAPIYLLSTDVPENDELARKITNRLYDNDERTRIAQSIVLGNAGGQLVEKLGGADIYHINEGHALPLAFYLKNNKFKSWEKLKKHFVFTTHTPESAGNEVHNAQLLNEMGFFEHTLSEKELNAVTYNEPDLNYTATALRFSKLANAVSKLHGEVSRKMWEGYEDTCDIISITNSQNQNYWANDKELNNNFEKNKNKALLERKKELKRQFFVEVASQTGKVLDPNVLTIVWARRFAAYKRADLLLSDMERFTKLVTNDDMPVQIVWSGKPYPLDTQAVETFNFIHKTVRDFKRCTILTDYELRLSHLCKIGTDVWLNTPRRPREASGTSGMTAAMNAAVNLSTYDGWVCEFIEHGKNGFIIPTVDETLPVEEQDRIDRDNFYDILENEILPLYYKKPTQWVKVVKESMKGVREQFNSNRMAREYYELLYNSKSGK